MTERRHRVRATETFLRRVDAIEAFLAAADAPQAFDALVDELERVVVPNLERFPRLGRRYLNHPPRSAAALSRLAELPPGAADGLRELLHGDYLVLYSVDEARETVHLLSIRHHRELSHDFAGLWPSGN